MAKRILAILAHEDDEVIGCGGLLALNRKQEGKNYVICVTGYDLSRKQEMEVACKVLGVDDLEMLGIEDILGCSKTEISDLLKSRIIKYIC